MSTTRAPACTPACSAARLVAWTTGPCGPSMASASGRSSGRTSPLCPAARSQRSIAKRWRCSDRMRRDRESRVSPGGATAPAAAPARPAFAASSGRPAPARHCGRPWGRGMPTGLKHSSSSRGFGAGGRCLAPFLALCSSCSIAACRAAMARAKSSGSARRAEVSWGLSSGGAGRGKVRTGSLSLTVIPCASVVGRGCAFHAADHFCALQAPEPSCAFQALDSFCALQVLDSFCALQARARWISGVLSIPWSRVSAWVALS
jgi:hypothetical protein